MPSVILTIEGSTYPEEIIVLGAHADSVVDVDDASIGVMVRALGIDPRSPNRPPRRVVRQMFIEKMNLEPTAEAPGADDNASGIAVITEVLRIFMRHNYPPERTVVFMAYAAEEIGLRGSEHIARSFAGEGKDVIGVLNFDMTNFRGSENLDLVLISDHTNFQQNKFLEVLIRTYLPEIQWEYDECGGCSDHASWHSEGFRASMLTEAISDELSPDWHKVTDTFEASGGSGEHSANFVRLALVYLVELDRFGRCSEPVY